MQCMPWMQFFVKIRMLDLKGGTFTPGAVYWDTTEIFLQLDGTKSTDIYSPRQRPSPKGARRSATRGPHHSWAWPEVGQDPALSWLCWEVSDAAPSPINSLCPINPKNTDHIPRKVSLPLSSSTLAQEGFEALPSTLLEGRSSPDSSTSLCLPQWCVSSSSLDYGSIAVARWFSLHLVPPCLDLVSCLT